MKCDNCGKPAFIQVKVVGPFGGRDVNLCHDCYADYMDRLKKEIISNSDFKFDSENELNDNKELFEELAKQISNVVEHLPFEKVQKKSEDDFSDEKLVCPVCNMPFEELKNYSSIGCKYCYKNFRDFILKNRSSHGYPKYYKGKFPKKFEDAKKILERLDVLSEELYLCLQEEKFEKCHEIQEEINRLESSVQDLRDKCYE